MIVLVFALLLGCRHAPPADAGAPPPPAPAASEAQPELPAWLREVLPSLQAQDWRAAEATLGRALEDPALTPQERALAYWYRASARAQLGERAGEIEDLRDFVVASRLVELGGDEVGATLRHRVSLAELAVAAEDAREDPAVGASPDRAISVLLASDEYFFLGRLACGPQGESGYTLVQQSLIHDERGVFDLLELRCEADGAPRAVWFDLAVWWELLGFSLGANPPPDGLDPEGARALMKMAMEQGGSP